MSAHSLTQLLESQPAREILEGVSEGIMLTHANGEIAYMNQAAQRMCGHSGTVAPVCFFKQVGDHVEEVESPSQRVLRGESVQHELFQLRSELFPEPVWAEISARSISGGALMNCVDVTRSKKAEASSDAAISAAETQSRFRVLLESAPDAIFEVDSKGRFVLVNAAAETIFGYTREEFMNLSVEALIPDSARSGHAAHRAEYNRNPGTRPMGIGMELTGRRKDGSEFPVEVSLSPVPSSSGHHVTAIVRDVTERKRATEFLRNMRDQFTKELEEKNKQLEQRNKEVERANGLKSEFLASMSHELRSPLHTIIGFADLLGEELDGPLNPKQKRFVGNIRRDSQHLLEIINDLLDISKIEAGRLELRLEQFAPDQLVEEVLSSIRAQARGKSIEIETEFHPSSLVESDKLRFKQILYNLLSNAVKFTPENGSIRVITKPSGSKLNVTVSDSGIGISPADHDAIFDKFYQVGSTTKGVREGTGLGLAITRQLVEKMGGKIWLDSAPGQGSRFIFSVRLAQVPKTISLEAKHRARPLVLLAEDSSHASDLMANYLEPAGYDVVRASSLPKTIQMARELRPDAVVLDLLLPSTEGWRVLREVKAHEDTASIPVIVASVLDMDDAATSLGAAAYLTKPVSKKILLDALKIAVSSKIVSPLVMVIDDEDQARQLLRDILTAAGYRVVAASNGKEALERISENKPDVVVLDLMMPEMDGFDFLFALRESPHTASIPAVVLTGKELSDGDVKLLHQTSRAILIKGEPWKSQLLEELRRAIP